MTKKREDSFKPLCLSIDLEVGKKDQRIHQLAAVRGDTGDSFVQGKKPIMESLVQLDKFAEGLTFLLGHNLIAFDLPHLNAAKPDLAILNMPAVDTLRLNPLAFPRNPYHHLVKHYQNGQLKRGRLNDPQLDARLTLDVFHDQRTAFIQLHKTQPELLLIWHWLTTSEGDISGLNAFFISIRHKVRPADTEARTAIETYLKHQACVNSLREALENAAQQAWPLAYAMAWMSVSGGNSVMPPWVRYQFPEAGRIIRKLRDIPCHDPVCTWCRERHDAKKELLRWFGFDSFRPEPADNDGKPLQQVIVEAAMQGKHVLGILPTGAGKSLCYQIPALSRYDKTGALTVVISPLVALMADQVAGLEARGIASCAALNGLLSMPERSDVLDRIRLGDIAILICSPEQLRNRAFRNVLAQREIGAWVLDEAHCISKWGHDFRPDYRYVGRFIREKAGNDPVPPVLCLTATAKPDVVMDIMSHFHDKVGIDLQLYDGGANRTNLDFSVIPTTPGEKFAHIFMVLEEYLPAEEPGGAIVYCATRKQTETISAFLTDKGLAAAYFHARLPPESKKNVQEQFIRGDLRVITATNAFGMGIDKPDVRLVIHADIPGSLENYLQEAGRAGRDRQAAHCVLLYSSDDIERQFGMSARSRLSRRDINAILRSLRRLNNKKHSGGEIIATSGEILAEDEDSVFERDTATDDTRVRTALLWLEESALLAREENQVQIFPSSLRVTTLEQGRDKLKKVPMTEQYRQQILTLLDNLIEADSDAGISTDELMAASGLSAEGVRHALYDLESLGIASNDMALTAFVHSGVARSSLKRYAETVDLERSLIDQMRQSGMEMSKGDSSLLHLRHATQKLKDEGHKQALPEKLWRLIRSISMDGHSEDGGRGSIAIRRLDPETVRITLYRNWPALEKTAHLRRDAAGKLLNYLMTCVPEGQRGSDVLAETTFGQLLDVLQSDLSIKAESKDPQKLLDRALLWLHEQEIIRLNKGLAVFRPAMSIKLAKERRSFRKSDFTPLQIHYNEQVLQIHVIAEYAQLALKAMADALRLTMDYFSLNQDEFIQRWMPDRTKELALQTTPESLYAIVDSLNNIVQQRIVTDDREQTNVLVLAGPGSGKTRVLVHRMAYLIRMRRENPRGILALTYNRHAAVEVRQRLFALIGDDAKGVTVLTCHALAMRLVGASFAGRANMDDDVFSDVLKQAVVLLKGDDLTPDEADFQRERLLAGFRWILVDEYQDVGLEQYELISALAGRSIQNAEGRLSLFAVGDDDQNIYAFNGASVQFIRRFETDYQARLSYLTENFRSSFHIIHAAQCVIESAAERMKAEHPIIVNRTRQKQDPGGDWELLDPVNQGRVALLSAVNTIPGQAIAVMAELQRLAALKSDWSWSNVAVIAREWQYLESIRSYCELHDIPVSMADEEMPSVWRLRETQTLISWLQQREVSLIDVISIRDWLAQCHTQQEKNLWWELLQDCLDEYELETGGAELPSQHFVEWLVEWGREVRRKQKGLLLLTAHRAKGLEFDHVAVLDGGWGKSGRGDDQDAARRLYYVAMTRARNTLTLARFECYHPILDTLPEDQSFAARQSVAFTDIDPQLSRRYLRLSMRDIDIGFAGRFQAAHGIHTAIRELEAESELRLVKQSGDWQLQNNRGDVVGRLARSFQPPEDMYLVSARVIAVITRSREDTAEEFLAQVRCEHWEIVLPELVFAPVL